MHAAGLDAEAFEEADVRFHLALAVASGNRALELVMIAVRDSDRLPPARGAARAARSGRDARAARARARGDPRRGRGARRRAIAGELMRDHILGLYQEALR